MRKTISLNLFIIVLFCTKALASSGTFFTSLHSEKVTTDMELVTLGGITYFETKPQGEYLGIDDDIVPILSPEFLIKGKTTEPRKATVVAATIKGHPISGFKAVAGPKGMHVFIDLMSGNINLGKGLKYDVFHLHREIVFEEGEIKFPRKDNDKEIGVDVYICKKGARIAPAKAEGKLFIIGITHRFVPKEKTEK